MKDTPRLQGSRCLIMSASGQKRTLVTTPFHVCFAPESGHFSAWASTVGFMSTRPNTLGYVSGLLRMDPIGPVIDWAAAYPQATLVGRQNQRAVSAT